MKKPQIRLLVLDVDGTLTDGGIYVMEDGSQFKKYHAQDGLGIKTALSKGTEVGIISHSSTATAINSRANMLGLKYVYVGQASKWDILQQWLKELNIDLQHVAFIGDDINDLEIIQKVGFSACPVNAVEAIRREVDVVLSRKGGDAAVREFIDRFIL